MKISIITVTLNSEKTLRDTLNSVFSQTYKNVEHIIVDGGSKDTTLSILKDTQIKKENLYKKILVSMSQLILQFKKSSGKFICILNSDDIFQSNVILEKLALVVSKNKKIKIFLGNVAYFDNSDYYNITRYYTSSGFKSWKMKFGLMPPHPASLIRRDIYTKYGLYNKKLSNRSRFRIILKIICIKKIKIQNNR